MRRPTANVTAMATPPGTSWRRPERSNGLPVSRPARMPPARSAAAVVPRAAGRLLRPARYCLRPACRADPAAAGAPSRPCPGKLFIQLRCPRRALPVALARGGTASTASGYRSPGGADQVQRAVVSPHPLQAPDQYPEAGGVEEPDLVQVDDELVTVLAGQIDEQATQPRRRANIDLASTSTTSMPSLP